MRSGTLKIKRLSERAFLPEYSREGSSGLQLKIHYDFFLQSGGTVEVGLGFAVEIPFNHVGIITQSSWLGKNGVMVYRENIDEDFTDEIKVKLHNYSPVMKGFKTGRVIGYLTIIPYVRKKIEVVEDF